MPSIDDLMASDMEDAKAELTHWLAKDGENVSVRVNRAVAFKALTDTLLDACAMNPASAAKMSKGLLQWLAEVDATEDMRADAQQRWADISRLGFKRYLRTLSAVG